MSLYRDELDAARHRIDALEADLRARDDALRAREIALEEHEAELARLRRIAAVGTTLPPTGPGRRPARGSVWAVAFAALVCSTAASTAFLVLPPPAPVLLAPPPPPPPSPPDPAWNPAAELPATCRAAEGGSAAPDPCVTEHDLPQVVEPD